jgi:hypothetical protein
MIPLVYPNEIKIMNQGLFPATSFVRSAFAIDTGQLTPKQINMVASKKLIACSFIPGSRL